MGFFGDLIGGFTGKNQADAAKKADRRYRQGIDNAVNRARPVFNKGYNAAMDQYQPLADQGQQYNALLADLYGVNGPDAQAAAQEMYMADPMRQGQLSMAIRGVDRGANASGLYGSGRMALAGERAAQGLYNDWMQGFGNQAAQGAGYIGNRAMLDIDKGNTIGNMLYGSEAAKAQSSANSAQQVGQAKSMFANNLLGVAGLGVKAYTGGMFGGK